MKVPTTPTEGLFLKYFVLKMDGSDPEAVEAAVYYAKIKGNKILAADLQKHANSLKFGGK